MQIDINRLQIFYYIYEAQGITKAADILCVSPPAVSQQLKKLEEELQVSLFTRMNRRLIPTSDANKLFKLLAPLIQGLQLGIEQIDQGRKEPVGTITFGAPIMFGAHHLTRIIAGFKEKYQKVDFDMHLGRPTELVNLVERGNIDFTFIDDFPTQSKKDIWEGFHVTPLLKESVVLACSSRYNDEVLKNDHSLDSLMNASYITQQYGELSIKKWFMQHFSVESSNLKRVLNVPNHDAVTTAIRCNLGLGIIAAHLSERAIKRKEIVVIREKTKQTTNNISILTLANKIQTIREKMFINYVIHSVKKLSEYSGSSSGNNRLGLQFIYPEGLLDK